MAAPVLNYSHQSNH
uniref:Uncharacterized protein n=1 Tax=Anguilla anguilla TaxID=7936 RepID=A0A0E9TXA4_ANGAN